MKITWLGHSGFIWEAEETRILIDPFLEGNPKAPYSHSHAFWDLPGSG